MTGMIRNWWTGLSRREHGMVAVAGALAVAVALWLISGPLLSGYAALSTQYAQAVEREGRVSVKVDLLSQGAVGGKGTDIGAAGFEQYLYQSASEIGLTLDRNEARGDRQAVIAIARAKASALTGWLAGLEEKGVVIDQLTITPGNDGTVGMTAELRRGGV